MINFFVTQAGRNGIRDYLNARGRPIAERVIVHEYETLGEMTSLRNGGTVLAALDQTTPAQTAAASAVYDQLVRATPAVPVLNDPRRVLRRFDLLTRLHEAGCNRYRAVRGVDDPAALRFPVFIRREHSHDGSLTGLLPSRRALDQALVELAFRGVALSQLLIVEFCDTRGPDGLFRKYSAMRIGDAIVPRHLHVSEHWVAKSGTMSRQEENVREELDYVESQRDERWLRSVFDLAQIEYGRIDYGIHKGEPQVWEINTNPTLGRPSTRVARADDEPYRRLSEPGRALAHERMLEAFRRIDTPGDCCEVPIVLETSLMDRLRQDRDRACVRASIPQGQSRLERYPRLKRLAKTVFTATAATVAPALARAVRLRHRDARH